MLNMFINIVFVSVVFAAIWIYYKRLDKVSKEKCDFRDDGHLHLIYPE